MRLLIGGFDLSIGQLGHDRIIMDENAIPVEPIQATTGSVILTIDAAERRFPVRLATPLSGGKSVDGSRIISLVVEPTR